MNRELAENLVRTNEEYTKLRARRADRTWATDSPRGRSPGARGLKRPDLETWTTEELRRAAATLGVPATDVMPRSALVDVLLSVELAAVTGRRRARR